ncbi:MAG: hypothetical protein ABI377_06995 [Devosia sp.]
MRTLKILLAVVPALLVMAPTLSFALHVSIITQGQMEAMCGNGAKTGGGHTGCDRPCGKMWCDYDCDNKSGKCNAVIFLTTGQPGKLPDVKAEDSVPASLVTPVPGGGSAAPASVPVFE